MIDPDRTQATSEKVSSKKLKTSVAQTATNDNDVISDRHLGSRCQKLSPLHRRERVMLFRHKDCPNRTRYKGPREI